MQGMNARTNVRAYVIGNNHAVGTNYSELHRKIMGISATSKRHRCMLHNAMLASTSASLTPSLMHISIVIEKNL